MHWHCMVFWGKSLLDNIPKVEAITATISLSPIDFWQCKGCRPPRSRTVGTRLGRRAPWEQASQATPINQIGSVSVMVMTIIIIIILSPAKLLIMRSLEQKSSALWESWCPLAAWRCRCNPSPNLGIIFIKTIDNDNLHKLHFIPSQKFLHCPDPPNSKKNNAPPPPLPAHLGILLSLFLVSRFKNPHFFQQISAIPLE